METTSWMVSSWGRAGSVALALRLQWHLARLSPTGTSPWLYLDQHEVNVDLPAHSVCHNHSLEQVDAVITAGRRYGHVFALRTPSWAALSSVLIGDVQYSHAYTGAHYARCMLDLMGRNPDADAQYCARVVAQFHARGRRQRSWVDMEALRYRRWVAMNWNDIAALLAPKLPGPCHALDHDQWSGDADAAMRSIGFGAVPEEALTVVRDDWPIMDRVENRDEVAAFVAQHADEDGTCMRRWLAAMESAA
jgi:hypothetical protein